MGWTTISGFGTLTAIRRGNGQSGLVPSGLSRCSIKDELKTPIGFSIFYRKQTGPYILSLRDEHHGSYIVHPFFGSRTIGILASLKSRYLWSDGLFEVDESLSFQFSFALFGGRASWYEIRRCVYIDLNSYVVIMLSRLLSIWLLATTTTSCAVIVGCVCRRSASAVKLITNTIPTIPANQTSLPGRGKELLVGPSLPPKSSCTHKDWFIQQRCVSEVLRFSNEMKRTNLPLHPRR